MKYTDKELFNRYTKLSNFYKKLVQLMALSHEPLTSNMVFKCLQRLAIHPPTRRITGSDTIYHLDELIQQNFIRRAESGYYEITPTIEDEVVKDLYKGRDFTYFCDTLQSFMPVFSYSSWHSIPLKRYYRSIRIALLKGDFRKINELADAGRRQHGDDFKYEQVYGIVIDSFDEKWLKKLPEVVIAQSCSGVLLKLLEGFEFNEKFFDFIENDKLNQASEHKTIYLEIILWRYILEGNFEKAEAINAKFRKNSSLTYSNQGVLEFMKGDFEKIENLYNLADAQFKKENRKRNAYMPSISAQFLYLSLFQDGKSIYTIDVESYYQKVDKYLPLNSTIEALLAVQRNLMNAVRTAFNNNNDEGFAFIFLNYTKKWIYADQAEIDTDVLEKLFKRALEQNLKYPLFLIADLLQQTFQYQQEKSKVDYYNAVKNDLIKEFGFASILNLIPVIEPWERAINALKNLSNQFEQGNVNSHFKNRLIWLINFKALSLEVKEQKIGKNGKWTKGRTVSYDRLSRMTDEDFVTEQDVQVIHSIEESSMWGYNPSEYDFNDNLIRALVGHPNLYLNNTQRTQVEIVKEDPQLIINRIGNRFELKFNLDVDDVGIRLVKETPTRYKAIDVTEQHLMIVNAIGNDKVLLPANTENELTDIVKGFSRVVNVQSDLLAQDIDVRKVEADSSIHLHMLPMGDGFQMEMYVKPFQTHPPYFTPAEGGAVIITEIDGERIQTERDLEKEKTLAKIVIKACPSLGNVKKLNKIWEFQSPEECLEILTELQPLRDNEQVILEWPKGERLKLKGVASFDQFSMNIKGSTDWFEASGELKVGEDLVMSMKEILKLMENSQSRFIQLKDGQFLALTNRFKQQLKAIEAYSDPTKDGLKFHPLAAFALEDFANEANELEVDAAWRAQLKRLKDAENKIPKVPQSFQAEFRPYQQEGYDWLMKLSNWGVGACLADDMGLGKTVQALAAILERAKDGPALVVCPASVRINWQREAEKFTPSLIPIQFGDGDRKQILNQLEPYDILITSYGLMTSETEKLSKIKFSTIVLDEAQAIKNRSAKRSKAAMDLDGDFKIITTGTPIENHLGELWNLFRFINPGLLGSISRFRDKFAIPIERYGVEEAREQLKKLIRPFILRRRKDEVLKELPPKTEILLTVDLSPQEKAFYEALRQTAMEKLKDVQPGDGGTHLQILAEITRLRQACCNPKLVSPTTSIRSSKLELFNQTIAELLENGHKVLVFSQFVQHLKILEDALIDQDIQYQYLDGSTTQKKRQKAIDEFQGGNGDVFLISLKAGGVGLNLTAADYVIHMDPWWNPAVEDQASDRAHRIGQTRPVTIYRLVTQGTIEEKIVKLHDQKRDLADSLLSGTNKGNKLTADDLMDLIREGMK